MRNVWFEAQKLQLNISSNIKPGFDYSFDKNVKKDIKAEMLSFMKWIEDSYGIPITIRIDFLYKNYLINRSKKELVFVFIGVILSITHLFIILMILRSLRYL